MTRKQFESKVIRRPDSVPIVFTVKNRKDSLCIAVGDIVSCHARDKIVNVNEDAERTKVRVTDVSNCIINGEIITQGQFRYGEAVSFSMAYVFGCSKA